MAFTKIVTESNLVASVEAGSDSNTFTDADHTKLNAIEASADVTDSTNVTAAGALMDSELAGIAAVKATTGTFLSADESKLDAIEASADVTDATNVSSAGALMKSGGVMTGSIQTGANNDLYIGTTQSAVSIQDGSGQEFVVATDDTQRLKIDLDGDATFYQSVKVNNAYTLPTTVTGTNDYVLTGQTNGTTAWAASGGGGGSSTLYMHQALQIQHDGHYTRFAGHYGTENVTWAINYIEDESRSVTGSSLGGYVQYKYNDMMFWDSDVKIKRVIFNGYLNLPSNSGRYAFWLGSWGWTNVVSQSNWVLQNICRMYSTDYNSFLNTSGSARRSVFAYDADGYSNSYTSNAIQLVMDNGNDYLQCLNIGAGVSDTDSTLAGGGSLGGITGMERTSGDFINKKGDAFALGFGKNDSFSGSSSSDYYCFGHAIIEYEEV